MPDSWQEIAAANQKHVLDAIPSKWKLNPEQKEKYSKLTDVRPVPRDCGLLTAEQLEITESKAVDILANLKSKKWSSVQVTQAFCGRAAIAHQMVRLALLE